MEFENEINSNLEGWKDLLEKYAQTHSCERTSEEQEKQSSEDLVSYLKQQSSSATELIPKFFFKKPMTYNDITFLIKSEAKSRFLTNKELWHELKLKQNHSPPLDGTERINYRDFKKVGEKLGAIFSDFFKATNFLKFDKDKYGRIETLAFCHYVLRKTDADKNRIKLSFSDVYCEGYLTDKELESWIKEEIKEFYFHKSITEEIKEYYLLVAQRKFFFFLDQKRTGKIYIKDIVTSPILAEFNEMKERTPSLEKEALIDEEHNLNSSNWFSLSNFMRIYKKYIELDVDRNGMLSRKELIRFGPGLTMIFIDRIFEEYQKYENAIDFKQFIDFVLSLENRKHPSSIAYIWKAIDVYRRNAVDTFVINMFYRQVVRKLLNRGKGEYKIDDIKDEIWDMIKPQNQNYITLQDVVASSYSDTVLSLLIDAKAFYSHDQKENQVRYLFYLVCRRI